MIYCIGDSFTAGDELTGWSDHFDSNKKPYPTHPSAWPSLLEQKLNHPVVNLGRGGCGNTRIIKRAIDIALDQPDIVIVAWTDILRLELADDLSPFDYWAGRNIKRMSSGYLREPLVKWLTVNQNNPEIEKWYYAAWLRQIILLQSFFNLRNQKYIMLSSNPLYQYRKYSEEYKKLTDQIDVTHFLGWPKWSMMEWAHGLPKGPHGHFLEDGHKLVADKVYEHIGNLGWLS